MQHRLSGKATQTRAKTQLPSQLLSVRGARVSVRTRVWSKRARGGERRLGAAARPSGRAEDSLRRLARAAEGDGQGGSSGVPALRRPRKKPYLSGLRQGAGLGRSRRAARRLLVLRLRTPRGSRQLPSREKDPDAAAQGSHPPGPGCRRPTPPSRPALPSRRENKGPDGARSTSSLLILTPQPTAAWLMTHPEIL